MKDLRAIGEPMGTRPMAIRRIGPAGGGTVGGERGAELQNQFFFRILLFRAGGVGAGQ